MDDSKHSQPIQKLSELMKFAYAGENTLRARLAMSSQLAAGSGANRHGRFDGCLYTGVGWDLRMNLGSTIKFLTV